MPLKRCQADGKNGWKWGDSGKCYTGPGAKEKAKEQGRAIERNKHLKGEVSTESPADLLNLYNQEDDSENTAK